MIKASYLLRSTIFEEGELNENVAVRNFRTTTQHGAIVDKTQSHDVNYYGLDVIISVGYRVKSLQGTQFRVWATQRLRDKELERDIKKLGKKHN